MRRKKLGDWERDCDDITQFKMAASGVKLWRSLQFGPSTALLKVHAYFDRELGMCKELSILLNHNLDSLL